MSKLALGSVLPVLVALLALPAAAVDLYPKVSPPAKVSQTVGLTEITVAYSSPSVKGRKIWGELVPWNRLWRTGANASTQVTFTHDVSFGGTQVAAGTYTLATVPTPKGWTVILNKELELFDTRPYNPQDDVARVQATVSAIPHRERLTFIFSNTTETETSLDMEWEKLRVSVPIKVDTERHTVARIQETVDEAWRKYIFTANYYSDTKKDYALALKFAEISLAYDSNWYNNWDVAQIHAAKGDFAAARKYAQTSLDLGSRSPGFPAREREAILRALAEWWNK
jgi:hypothetical protein